VSIDFWEIWDSGAGTLVRHPCIGCLPKDTRGDVVNYRNLGGEEEGSWDEEVSSTRRGKPI
jgi:hypothetical protein